MVRSPAGRLHVTTREQFEAELERIDVEVRHEEADTPRLDFDAIFAKVGYVMIDGHFTEVDSGARCS